MSDEVMVTIYWPGPPFEFLHHARKLKIQNGESVFPKSLALRLMQQFSLNGLVGLPQPEVAKDGTETPPSADLVAAVKAAADARNGAAHRLAGQVPVKFDETGKPAAPATLLRSEGAGSKLSAPEQPKQEEPKQEEPVKA